MAWHSFGRNIALNPGDCKAKLFYDIHTAGILQFFVKILGLQLLLLNYGRRYGLGRVVGTLLGISDGNYRGSTGSSWAVCMVLFKDQPLLNALFLLSALFVRRI